MSSLRQTQPLSEPLRLSVGALSETGYVRQENQDRMSWDVVPLGNLFIVADGMGGHQGGSTAAELTIDTVRKELEKVEAGCDVRESLNVAIVHSNRMVHEARLSPESPYPKMGSTVVALLITERKAWVAHVGDSRAYLFRKGELKRLTTDHTRVQEMVEKSIISAEEAEQHPKGHILSRAIGSYSNVEVEISSPIIIQSGDAFLLCSDGLSGFVNDAEVELVLRIPASPQELTKIMMSRALGKGGHDNVTIQYIQYS